MYYHGLISGLQSNHLNPELVQVVLHGFPLVLLDIKNIVRKPGGGLVYKVLFPEQCGILVEASDVSVGKADEPF